MGTIVEMASGAMPTALGRHAVPDRLRKGANARPQILSYDGRPARPENYNSPARQSASGAVSRQPGTRI